MRRSFAKALGGFAIVVAACISAGLLDELAVWIGWKLPPALFNSMLNWMPRDIYDEYYNEIETYLAKDSPISSSVFYVDIVRHAIAAFFSQGLALFAAAYWIHCWSWPRYWLDFAPARRRSILMSAWWQSALFLIITLPVVELVWLIFYRIWNTAHSDPRFTTPDISGHFHFIALDMSSIPFYTNYFSILVIQALAITHILTRSIRNSVSETNRRCMRCGYRLAATVLVYV